MAYHSEYWNRWRPAEVLPRGRPKKQRRDEGGRVHGDAAQGSAGGTSSDAAASGEAAASGGADGRVSGGTSSVAASSETAASSGGQAAVEWAEDGGRRIGEACVSTVRGQGDGRGRGRPRATGVAEVRGSALGKRNVRSTRWNAVSRNVYQQVQQGCRGTRYERGEGGGVT